MPVFLAKLAFVYNKYQCHNQNKSSYLKDFTIRKDSIFFDQGAKLRKRFDSMTGLVKLVTGQIKFIKFLNFYKGCVFFDVFTDH